ncbi:MAG: hypothetical protein M0D57_14765 [Sphingobacteriales bacterium JAD_PAG50586_3]|nr:MAG: hypothetical protein M0D57_14765 [Sphingobacteriales bacterium JAD_PAG50586_3]
MKKSILLIATFVFSAIGFNAAAQYYSKPFIDLFEGAAKKLKGNKPADTVMTAKKMAEMFDFSKSLQEAITKQIFSDEIFPAQIDSFKLSQGQATPYRGLGIGAIRTYNNVATNQLLTMEASTDTSQFYSIRYYMNNSSTITKGNPTVSVTPIKLNDKYEGFLYKTQGYSFVQVMLENAYLKLTTMDVKKGDKTISNLSADGYKKLAKKYDIDKLNKATQLK